MHKLCVVTYEKEKKIQLHTVLQGNKKETNIRKKTNTKHLDISRNQHCRNWRNNAFFVQKKTYYDVNI